MRTDLVGVYALETSRLWSGDRKTATRSSPRRHCRGMISVPREGKEPAVPNPDRAPTEVARRFIDRINAQDVPGLVTLMTEDYRFIDATDQIVFGRETMKTAWERYFSWFPDYRIEVANIVATEDVVAIFGHASGSFSGKAPDPRLAAWRLPAAWKAVVRDGQLAEWRVYCDVEPMLQSVGAGRFDRKVPSGGGGGR